MDVRELRYFASIAELKSFSRAAGQLRIAQPALSRCIRRLEEDLGVMLLERHGRGVTLTEAGQTLYDRAQVLLSGLRQTRETVASASGLPAGSVRLAVPPATGQVLAPSVIERYRTLYPQVSIHIQEGFSGYMHEWLMEGRVDVAIMHDPVRDQNVEIHHLLTEHMFVVTPGPKADGYKHWPHAENYGIADLARLPLILPSRPHNLRMLMEQAAADHGIKLNVILEVDCLPIIKSLVMRGLGATVFAYVAVTSEVAAGSLSAMRIADPGIHWRLAVATRRDRRKAPATLELIRIIDEEVRDLVRREIWQGSPEIAPAA